MSHQIYRNRNFKIYKTLNEYIVHNSNKDFEQGHTHIQNFDTAKYLIHLSIHRIVPKRLSKYLIVSLIRLSDSREYTEKLKEKLGGNYSGKDCSFK